MKRALFGVLAAVLVLNTGTMNVSAAGRHHGGHHAPCRKTVCCAEYADADCDGICDYCGSVHAVQRNRGTAYRSCGRRCHR